MGIVSIIRSGATIIFAWANGNIARIQSPSIISINPVANSVYIDIQDSDFIILDATIVTTPVNSGANDLSEKVQDLVNAALLEAGGALANRVIVTQAGDLAGTLDSTKQYFVDGSIDMAAQSIEVPAGGLQLSGYGFDQSLLFSSSNNFSLFTSPVGGSGNLLITDIAIQVNGTGSKVYDLTDLDGTHAIECNIVNYNNCSSLGEITDYRQGLESGTGRLGGNPELTLSGNWNGFRITTSIVRGISNVTVLFKAGTGLQFSGRVLSDINCDLPATGALFDFAAANFLNDESFIIKGSFVTRQGVIDASDTTIYPNINAFSTKVIWSDNVGLPNTTKYIKANITTAIETVISEDSTYYVLAGTYTLERNSHFDMPANGVFRLLSGNGTYNFTGDFTLRGTSGDELSIRVSKSTDNGATFPTEIAHIIRVVNNLAGNRDVAFFPINFLEDLKAGDRVRIEIENYTAARDVTAELESFFIITQV